jgi:PII-like signaling protein
MKMVDVTMVRIYLSEGQRDTSKAIEWFEKHADVRGFTVFRGIEGLGKHGTVHKASLLGLITELPIVIEFFDVPERVTEILEQLRSMVKADHIVMWSAKSGS